MRRPTEPQAQLVREAIAASVAPLTIGFIGSGRAAAAIGRGLAKAGHDIVLARRGEGTEALAATLDARLVDRREVLTSADVTFLAVPDAVVPVLASELAAEVADGEGRAVAHLAGSLGRSALAPLAARGYRAVAIHPLQVLSGWRIAAGTGFAVDAAPDAIELAARLVSDLGGIQFAVPERSRAAYHAAAVIAANLGMTMLAEAVDLLEGQGIERSEAMQGLAALVRGGLEAAMDRGLPGALTGPVARGDLATVAGHLDALAGDPELLRAYARGSLLTLRQAERDGRPANPATIVAMRRLLEDAI